MNGGETGKPKIERVPERQHTRLPKHHVVGQRKNSGYADLAKKCQSRTRREAKRQDGQKGRNR